MRWELGWSRRGRWSWRSWICSRHRQSIILPVKEVQIWTGNNPATYSKDGENFFSKSIKGRVAKPSSHLRPLPNLVMRLLPSSTAASHDRLMVCTRTTSPLPWSKQHGLSDSGYGRFLCFFQWRLFQLLTKYIAEDFFSPEVQRPMCVADHSTLFTAEVTNAWSIISTTPVHLLGHSNAAVNPNSCRWGYTLLK